MKTARTVLAAVSAIALCISLAACGSPEASTASASSSASSSATQSAATSASSETSSSTDAAYDSSDIHNVAAGTPIFDFIAKENPQEAWLGDGFSADQVQSVSYLQEGKDQVTSSNPADVQRIVNALASVVVTGPATDDVIATDGIGSVAIVSNEGNEYTVVFDMDCLVMDGQMYATANRSQFASACESFLNNAAKSQG